MLLPAAGEPRSRRAGFRTGDTEDHASEDATEMELLERAEGDGPWSPGGGRGHGTDGSGCGSSFGPRKG